MSLFKPDLISCLRNYYHPIAQKTIGGIDIRITDGIMESVGSVDVKTYLLYADGFFIMKGYSVNGLKDEAEFLFG